MFLLLDQYFQDYKESKISFATSSILPLFYYISYPSQLMFQSLAFETSLADILVSRPLQAATKVFFYCFIIHPPLSLGHRIRNAIKFVPFPMDLLFTCPSFLFFSILLPILFDSIITDGKLWNHAFTQIAKNEPLAPEDEWSMEVDLRSAEKEKRTLHWFVNGEQQKGFIKGVPEEVEFGV